MCSYRVQPLALTLPSQGALTITPDIPQENHTTYVCYEFTVGHKADAPISKFEATLTVPPFSKDGRHIFVAGLTNQAKNYAYENRLSDHNPGKWEVDLIHDHGGIATENNILPGDKIHTLLEYNQAGLKTRFTTQAANIQQEAPTAGKLNVARLYVAFSKCGVWDFGPILWEDVTISSQTTDPWWCNDVWKASDNLQVTGRVTMFWGNGDKTNCKYEHMTWEPSKK
ncbi:04a4f238-aea1-403a-8f9a-f61f271fefb7 [Sclerotinia trifoliorum]|uniref:04a4f238-aea1-403a-8f9a-f61f271fefb7 n=1 Tax=Sclerotinia trifoliorum TaxID=28548 RepID=A0A8H2ZJC0_9HELO|nr:04a4f238-aea1-403a-8f9a-f61f271fefb7 [Sclerotinia trifoliorum]